LRAGPILLDLGMYYGDGSNGVKIRNWAMHKQ
jgi:hypothetical protein